MIVPEGLLRYTLDLFNSIHPKIQFTYVREENNVLPYLDILLTHNPDGSIDFNWYPKPTSSNRLLHYRSNHPSTHKLNVMHSLIKRLYVLNSKQFHQEDTKIIKDILRQNDYPIKLVNQRIKKYFSCYKFK